MASGHGRQVGKEMTKRNRSRTILGGARRRNHGVSNMCVTRILVGDRLVGTSRKRSRIILGASKLGTMERHRKRHHAASKLGTMVRIRI